MRALVVAAACVMVHPAFADEGMWTFDHFPTSAVKQTYGADISAWLDNVRLSTLRLANCSASFVSSEGLILTNHHCIEACLAELSGKEKSYLQLGFSAATRKEEQRCIAQHADVLVGVEDISEQVLRAVAGLSDVSANEARKRSLTLLEQSCIQASAKTIGGRLECQAVNLYQGGQYFLYKYKRFDDLRIVFTPETDIAQFGGDPDNFQFPRWSLDFALLRAYENDKPAHTPNFLRIDFAGPQAGQLVFVTGAPGSTSRQHTRAQLEFERRVALPLTLLRASELRGRYIQFAKGGAASREIVAAPLDSLQNVLKLTRNELDALNDETLLAGKSAAELALKQRAQLTDRDPWREVEAASERERTLIYPYVFVENGAGFGSALFRDARLLMRAAEERSKPNGERLREYTDAALPQMQRALFANVPVYPEFEQLTLSFSLERMREWLGPDHPIVRRLLSTETPDALATRLIAETKLDDAAVRKQLWEGGKSAVAASRDPMLELVRSIDADARVIRKQFEDEVEAPIARATQAIAEARFKAYGTNTYPDATFTLRLNYGTVQGWVENGLAVAPFTHLDRLFARSTGAAPFNIPDSWLKVKSQLDMDTPYCFVTSNDIVGGNSGSALIDASGKIVGLMFDGNIHSIAGHYWFDPGNNRAIAVHPAIIREALAKVYGAKRLLAELGGA